MFSKINSVLAFILAVAASTSYGLVTSGPRDGRHECASLYQVQPGDTCYKISQEQGVSTYQLWSINQAFINPECTNLRPDDWLCLGLVSRWCRPVYTVEPGDTCYKIADQFHISVDDLRAHDPSINAGCTNIDVGEVLCVAPASSLGIAIWCSKVQRQWLRSSDGRLKIGLQVNVVRVQSIKCNCVASDSFHDNMNLFPFHTYQFDNYLKLKLQHFNYTSPLIYYGEIIGHGNEQTKNIQLEPSR